MSYSHEEFADHGRPHGGRPGGERLQRPQDMPPTRGASAGGGSDRADADQGEYF